MNRSIRTTVSAANRKPPDFIQAILGKYGMTRWRRRFQSLILRQYPLLFAEQGAEKPADAVINNIHSVQHTHIHHSIYNPVTQAGSVSRILHITQGSRGAGTGNPFLYPGNDDAVRSDGSSIAAAGRPDSIQVLQERIRKQQSTKSLVTTAYRITDPAKSAVEPGTSQAAVNNQKQTLDTSLSYLPLLSGAAERTDLAEKRTGSRLVPDFRDSRLRESITGESPYDLTATRHQLQTLRTYSMYQNADNVAIDQPVREKPGPLDTRYGREWPQIMALKSNREAVSGSAGTAVEAQYSTPSLIFRPNPDPLSLVRSVLHLGLGQKLTAALEKLDTRNELLSPLTLQPIGIPSEPLFRVQQDDSIPLSGTVKPLYPGGQLPVAPKPGLVYTVKGLALPSSPQRRGPGSKLLTAGPGHEEHIQPGGSYSNLILRKPEVPKTARSEPVQQPMEQVLPELAARLPSQVFVKAAPVVKMDSAELNQLAERVYQVLEKKMAIRKDRRGLR